MSTQDAITGGFGFTPSPIPQPSPPGTLAGTLDISGDAAALLRQAAGGPHEVTLQRASAPPTADQLLWTAIRNRTDAIGFGRYSAFIQRLLCEQTDPGAATCGGEEGATVGGFGVPSIDARVADLLARPGIYGDAPYELLKAATRAFLLYEGGVAIELPRGGGAADAARIEQEEAARLGRPISLAEARAQLEDYLATQVGTVAGRSLPYLKRVADALIPDGQRGEGSPFCEGTLRRRLHCPALIELFYNYWQDQAGVAQTMNAILLRFQNRRRGSGDPLASLAIDPLRGAAVLFWGRLQAEPQQLSVARRAHEFVYAYGLTLHGRAVADLAPVESRVQFIEAFHDLLREAAAFHERDADTTIRADAFGLLQRLKELHLVLAEAANNQWPEITRQAREELLLDQYLLARREVREFLRGRPMVPTSETWIPQVDTMRRLQGWLPQVSAAHFHTLAVTGEQLLLSARYGDWSVVLDQAAAVNWARYWKAEVQSYLHAYQVVSGVALAAEAGVLQDAADRYRQPAELLSRRMRALPARGLPLEREGAPR